MNEVLSLLKLYKKQLTSQQIKTLKGQVLSGDEAGALKGLLKLTKGVSENAEKTERNAEWTTAY